MQMPRRVLSHNRNILLGWQQKSLRLLLMKYKTFHEIDIFGKKV